MNKKRIVALVTAGIITIGSLAIAVNMNSKPAHALTAEEAKVLAANVLPGTVEHLSTDEDDSLATYEYYDETSQTLFEVKVDLKKGEISNIREYSMDQELVPAETSQRSTEAPKTAESGKREMISREAAETIALNKVSGAVASDIREFELDDRNERGAEYEIDIIFDGYKYELEINAYTGDIEAFEREAVRTSASTSAAATTAPATQATAAPARSSLISRERAIEIALAQVPGASLAHVEDVEFDDADDDDDDDDDDDRPEWEIEIEIGDYEYEIVIDARNENILEIEIDD